MNRTVFRVTLCAALSEAAFAMAEVVPPHSQRPGVVSNETTLPHDCARGTPLDWSSVVRCALAGSPEVKEARAQLVAIAGRRVAAGVWLPSNPVAAGTFSHRTRPAPEAATALNWSVTLSQEIEIAGQRGRRLEMVDAEAAAQVRRVGVTEQEVGAAALSVWFEAAAANEGLRIAEDLARTASALATLAEGRAREALLSGVDADVARAEAVRIGLARLEARRRLSASRDILALFVGGESGQVTLPDKLVPPSTGLPPSEMLMEQALHLRGELAAAEAERRVLEHRLSLLRRERVPNPTLSAFGERGELADRIIGVGVSFPIPLPAPIGRTRAGEIAETIGYIRAAESSIELVRRRVRVEVARASAAYDARTQASALFAGDLLGRARSGLASLGDGIASRQLSLREALISQRSLMELLQTDIDTRLARALAWVELRRVVGLPFAPVRVETP